MEAELFTLQDSNAKLVSALQEAECSGQMWKKQLAEYQEETDRLREQVRTPDWSAHRPLLYVFCVCVRLSVRKSCRSVTLSVWVSHSIYICRRGTKTFFLVNFTISNLPIFQTVLTVCPSRMGMNLRRVHLQSAVCDHVTKELNQIKWFESQTRGSGFNPPIYTAKPVGIATPPTCSLLTFI